MSATPSIRMKSPAHAGGFVKHEIIEPHDLSVTDAARIVGVTRPALSALLNERASLSSEMALRFEKAFGVSMDTLMRLCRPATTSPRHESARARSTLLGSPVTRSRAALKLCSHGERGRRLSGL